MIKDVEEASNSACVPLTGEHWMPLEEGERLAMAGGRILKEATGSE